MVIMSLVAIGASRLIFSTPIPSASIRRANDLLSSSGANLMIPNDWNVICLLSRLQVVKRVYSWNCNY